MMAAKAIPGGTCQPLDPLGECDPARLRCNRADITRPTDGRAASGPL